MINILSISTKFHNQIVHQDLSLIIEPNRIITIIGNSGCGKTTLVRAILMLQPIVAGEIFLLGEKISNYHVDNPCTKKLLSTMGMMFQNGALFSSYTALENVMFPLVEYTTFSKAIITELAHIKLQLAGFPTTAYYKLPKELSPGMLKRVALARTLALDPTIVFLDEPTAGLDPNSAANFDELILDLQQQLQLTVIMITHDLDSIWRISNEVVYLGDKKVLFHGSLKTAATQEAIQSLYSYFNGTRGKISKHHYMTAMI